VGAKGPLAARNHLVRLQRHTGWVAWSYAYFFAVYRKVMSEYTEAD
jgi:hypothetical protein